MQGESFYAARRKRLWQLVSDHAQKPSILVIFAALEPSRTSFWQDSTFYYLTGIQEPGWVLVIDEKGVSHLYVPQTTIDRSIWLMVAESAAVDAMSGPYIWHDLGKPDQSYSLSLYAPQQTYAQLCNDLQAYIARGIIVYGCTVATSAYAVQREFIHKIFGWINYPLTSIRDCSSLISRLRRTKDAHEIDALNKAIAITRAAHSAAADVCRPGVTEARVKAALEAVMIEHGVVPAFPSIVATGVHGTILHYTGSKGVLQSGDMLVVDIGASYQQYAADITRTYAVSGERTQRQEDIYNRVLEVQQKIASRARPGIWLRNSKYPDQSLQHIAVDLFKKQKLDQYFMHGIGHYLGLDVHDVGSYEEPLKPGDVITIEPGLYIREEALGIRIEDNYLITDNGVECLSEAIAK